ncbi:MAG: VWA domain-containing protein [Legionellales bacterium]|nr:VWA domain-containing protein [Legionellales bacterium]
MFEFAWPWLLIILPLPWLLYWWLPVARQPAPSALRVPFFQDVLSLQPRQSILSKRWQVHGLIRLIWINLVIAAAGPQWLGEPVTIPQAGRNIILAVDLSGSMAIQDMQVGRRPVDRLTIVKQAAREFIQQRKGDRLGLILFGTRAYVQTPLTFDHQTVERMLEDATIALPGPETAIGDAIGLAIKRLQKVPEQSRVLVLLTDGANNAGVSSPKQAAAIAAKNNIKIYTIGIGATRMVINTFFGPQTVNPSHDLDETMLQEISEQTGGMFFRAFDRQQLQQVYQSIHELEPVENDETTYRPIESWYSYPLATALLLSLLLVGARLWSLNP